MSEDVLEDLVVAAEPAALDACLGPHPVELCRLQEGGVLRGPEQSLGVDVGPQRSARLDLDHAGFDRVPVEMARYRHPVMAVDHVVVVAQLVDVDRRQLATLGHLPVDRRPAIAGAVGDGKEAGIEVAGLAR